MRICKVCHRKLKLQDFSPDKRASDGRQARCKPCINHWMKEHAKKNPAWQMIRRAGDRSRKKGLEFSLKTMDILPLPKFCPVFGIPLTIGDGQQNPNAYSLDRIDNNKGYTPDNVVVMSYLANRLKNNGTAKQHEQIAAWMRTYS